jgi:hypothetical protein
MGLLLFAVAWVEFHRTAPGNTRFIHDLLALSVAVAFMFFMTGYLLTTVIFRAVWNGRKLWSYSVISAALFLIHFRNPKSRSGRGFRSAGKNADSSGRALHCLRLHPWWKLVAVESTCAGSCRELLMRALARAQHNPDLPRHPLRHLPQHILRLRQKRKLIHRASEPMVHPRHKHMRHINPRLLQPPRISLPLIP